MTTITLVDTHTVTPVAGERSKIANIPAGTKIKIQGKVFTTKASTSGQLSAYQLYLTEAQAFSALVAGASKATPVVVEFEVLS